MTDIDHAAIGRVYADNLLGEPAISRCLHAMADEIERLRTHADHTTHDEGSVHGEGTVGQRLVERLSITQAMLDDNEKLRAEIERLQRSVTSWRLESEVHRERARAAVVEIARLSEAIRRLAEQDATLAADEREAIDWCLSLPMLDRDAVRMMPLRSLLARLS